MEASVVARAGQSPTYAEFADQQAGAGEVVVEVAAAALSPLARALASGAHHSAGGGYPMVTGVDGIGWLDDGRRVYFLLPRAPFGAMAERTVFPDGNGRRCRTGSTTRSPPRSPSVRTSSPPAGSPRASC